MYLANIGSEKTVSYLRLLCMWCIFPKKKEKEMIKKGISHLIFFLATFIYFFVGTHTSVCLCGGSKTNYDSPTEYVPVTELSGVFTH